MTRPAWSGRTPPPFPLPARGEGEGALGKVAAQAGRGGGHADGDMPALQNDNGLRGVGVDSGDWGLLYCAGRSGPWWPSGAADASHLLPRGGRGESGADAVGRRPEVRGKIEREVRVNERIRAREVRLIDEKGAQLGIVAVSEALRIARERNLDLIEVAPNAQPPVCRIMDFGKHKYEQGRRERESRKKTKAGEVRLLRLKPQIGRHDLDIKVRKLRELLEEGNKVRISVRFRGREMSRPEMGTGLMEIITRELSDIAMAEGSVRQENRIMTLMLAPKPGSRPPKAPKEPKGPKEPKAPREPEVKDQEEKEKVAPHAQEQVQAEPIAQPLRQSEDAEDSGEAG